ncbi:MAG: EF-hand domain-containing protein [Deltaproteobacteria bacterium]|nr:EF-hand domain-containing protein [Deltaproteobacteria bacterium]PNV85250.1 MAG: hypothetical protein C0610_12770 [Desulfobacteraceae bacterium]MDH3802675.1 EF-hand domain-containing protein [Deltaproteobacteria bacterium]MDH3851242.1 EF-hand domain-containing protein [Deltaproteobacteria bacterium]MDH3898096.1 EF-hand domain-containing protein [Deltaproteobacteria bacterium]
MSKLKTMAMVVVTTAMFLGGNHVLAQYQSAPGGWMQDRFNSMDTNNDGKISYEEYMAYHQKLSEERFKSMDADGDGFVTQKEHQEAAGEFRGKMRRKGMKKGSSY